MNKPLTWSSKRSEVKPHYDAKFTPEQCNRFEQQEFHNVDSRSIRTMLGKTGIELEVTGPMNQGLILLAYKDGWYERTTGNVIDLSVEWGDDHHSHVIAYRKTDRKILSVSVPLGISKLAYVFKMQQDHQHPEQPEKMYVF